MPSFGELLKISNQAGMDFLNIELDTAHTFLQLAATTNVEATRVRNRANARTAYDSILQHSPQVTWQPEDKVRFEERLAELRGLLRKIDPDLQ